MGLADPGWKQGVRGFLAPPRALLPLPLRSGPVGLPRAGGSLVLLPACRVPPARGFLGSTSPPPRQCCFNASRPAGAGAAGLLLPGSPEQVSARWPGLVSGQRRARVFLAQVHLTPGAPTLRPVPGRETGRLWGSHWKFPSSLVLCPGSAWAPFCVESLLAGLRCPLALPGACARIRLAELQQAQVAASGCYCRAGGGLVASNPGQKV